jgi:hypothetical protein
MTAEELDFPCLNEEEGAECEYPFCDCEADYLSSYLEELPDIFGRLAEDGIDDEAFFEHDDDG